MNYNELQDIFNGQAKIIKLKGYSYLNKNEQYNVAKQPVEPGFNTDPAKWLSVEQAKEWIDKKGWLGLVIPTDYIVVDIDIHEEADLVQEILKNLKIKHHAIRTKRGWQFFFKDSGTVSSQTSEFFTWAGFAVDYRLANKGYIVLPIGRGTPEREWVTICTDDLDPMPIYFNPLFSLKKQERPFVLPIRQPGRNNTLNTHGFCLKQKFGLDDENITKIMRFIATHLYSPSCDDWNEVEGTIRSVLKVEKDKKMRLWKRR